MTPRDPLAERFYEAHGAWESHDGPTPDMFTMFANEARAFLAERVTREQIAETIYSSDPRTLKWPSWKELERYPSFRNDAYAMADAIFALLAREMGGTT